MLLFSGRGVREDEKKSRRDEERTTRIPFSIALLNSAVGVVTKSQRRVKVLVKI